MAHWKDQFRRQSAAKAADEEKRIDRSESWERGDPEKGVRSGGGPRIGIRSGSPSGPRFTPAGRSRGAGISLRASGGAEFEIEDQEPAPIEPVEETWEQPSAEKYLSDSTPADQPPAETAPHRPVDASPNKPAAGVLSRIASLLRRGE